MIRTVTFDEVTFNDIPHKFEAGTPNVAGAVGLDSALTYLSGIGLHPIERYEQQLTDYAIRALSTIEGLRLIGTAKRRTGVISFLLDDIHPHDIGTILDTHGIAIRTGHHCAQPTMKWFGVPATARVSIGLYNTVDEIDALVDTLCQVKEVFQ